MKHYTILYRRRNKQQRQRETRQDVCRVIIDAVGAAFERLVGTKAQMGSLNLTLVTTRNTDTTIGENDQQTNLSTEGNNKNKYNIPKVLNKAGRK